ncbi:MAG: NUDIX hydrolase [Ruminococcaceae bacterium]|nr:NUDIX hydrolase [Oscillospiraceae bacterium]
MAEHMERQTASTEIYKGHIFTITKDEVLLENGKPVTREVVHHTGGAAVVALNDRGEVALVRQYRYAAKQELIELPAGKLEPGEDPRETAIRELAEEAGLKADSVVPFGGVIPTPAYCTEVLYNYLATGLHTVPRNLDEDEFVDVFWLGLDEAVEMVLDGRITDAKTVAGLLRAQLLKVTGQLPV